MSQTNKDIEQSLPADRKRAAAAEEPVRGTPPAAWRAGAGAKLGSPRSVLRKKVGYA